MFDRKQIVASKNEPNKKDIWLNDDYLKIYNAGAWKTINNLPSSDKEEIDLTKYLVDDPYENEVYNSNDTKVIGTVKIFDIMSFLKDISGKDNFITYESDYNIYNLSEDVDEAVNKYLAGWSLEITLGKDNYDIINLNGTNYGGNYNFCCKPVVSKLILPSFYLMQWEGYGESNPEERRAESVIKLYLKNSDTSTRTIKLVKTQPSLVYVTSTTGGTYTGMSCFNYANLYVSYGLIPSFAQSITVTKDINNGFSHKVIIKLNDTVSFSLSDDSYSFDPFDLWDDYQVNE